MVVDKASILNIMGGMESTAGVRLHNHRRKLRQRFDIIKKLGQGTYGKVQLGINKETGQEVAIKTIKKSKIESDADLIRIRREIQIMSSVQHPNIIHIYEVFENREKMVLVMEYAAGGELYDFLSERKVLSEEEARRLFRQIATAVYYCHKHKICHRDLKLENILLDENGSAKIADFGLSNVFDETRLLGTFCGSPLYASPEIVQGTPYHGPEVDCWSLGVLLYTLVYGAMPFDGSNFKRLVKQISQGDYFEPKKPSPASPLIRDMLTVSATKRADISKICSHWWVNEGYSESCLEIAEHLANQTPVRLDLLLSLAPPMSADKVVVTKDQESNGQVAGALAEGPVRSHSVGSLMDLDQPSAERRIRDFVNSTKAESSKSRGNLDKVPETSKRKLEGGVSTEDASVGGAKKKERSRSKQRNSRSDRRSSSRNRKQEVMEVEPDVLTRSDSKELVLAAASAICQNLQESPCVDHPDKREEKKKPARAKLKPKSEENDIAAGDVSLLEAVVAEGKSGCEPTQEAKVPLNDAAATDEKGKFKKKKKGEDKSVDKLSDASPSDESARSSQSEQSVEEVQGEVNGVEVSSDGVVSIMSSSTAPVSLPLSDTDIDLASLDKAKSQGKISLSNILSPSSEMPIAVPIPSTPDEPEPPRSTERRKSKIFETAEKFNNLASTERKGSIVEKPKKIHIPGVKVSDAKAAFERKSSITSSTASVPSVERKGSITTAPPSVKNSASKKALQDSESKAKIGSPVSDVVSESKASENDIVQSIVDSGKSSETSPDESDRAKKLKEAVGVISSVIEGQVTGRRVSLKKPPKLNSFDSSRGGTPVPGTPLSPTSVDPSTGMKTVRVQVAPNDVRLATIQVSTPQATKYPDEEPPLRGTTVQSSSAVQDAGAEQPKKASSSMEITLKSATLPRRKTSKAEIQMGTPPAKAPSPEKLERMIQAPPSPGRRASVGQPLGGYRSEVEHMVGAADYPNRPRHQRSEVSFPVAAASSATRVHPTPYRSASCEPESCRPKPREHIIPIRLEGDDGPAPVTRTSTPPAKPPVPPTTSQSASGNLPYQRTLSQLSQRSNSLSRQSTQDSDTESTISQTGGEPIRKSPREYIIPIAVEGGGYVTPRATSLEPSEESKASTHSLPRSRFSRTKRMSRERHRSKFSSLLSESEDEGPFAALHRHSSIGRDSDNEDRPSSIHLHRLRSSRPIQRTLEHTDSVSSAEEEDDDEGFEILTAENLFSSLLSRVRSLTQRLNVEDGGRPGFPSSRLLSQFPSQASLRASPFMFPSILNRGSPFEPLSRRVSETSRSFSRNDSESGSIGPTPWRRSVSRDVSDSDSIFSESHNSGTLPRGRSSGDFSESSSLSSYSLTPGLASRLAQYQHSDGAGAGAGAGAGGAAPERERRLARAYIKSRSAGVPPLQSSSSANEDVAAGAPSPSPCTSRRYSSARRAARALEEELNGLDIPTSYLPTPTTTTLSRSVDESAARRLGIGRTLSMRERPASPSNSFYPSLSRASRSGLGLGGSTSETYSWERPSSTLSPRRRPFAYTSSLSDSGGTGDYRRSYLESSSEKELPPLPFVSRRLGTAATQDRTKRPADTSEEDCTYYEILPYHRKESVRTESMGDVLTRSCPSAAFLGDGTDSHGEPKLDSSLPESSDRAANDDVASVRSELVSLATPRHFRSVSVTRELSHSPTAESPTVDRESVPSLRRSLSSTRADPGSDRSILSKLFRPSSTSSSDSAEVKPKGRRVSRFLRPDFFDTPREESVYAKERDLQKAAEQQHKKENDVVVPRASDEKMSSTKSSSRFLQSLERKLERLRSGPSAAAPTQPVSSTTSMSTGRRIESTIRSLREQSLEPKESDSAPTESSLLKRAVSVSDVGHLDKTTPSTKKSSGSVRLFGLFRKDPADVSKGLIPTFRTPRAYAGSRSDSHVLDADVPVLSSHGQDNTDVSPTEPAGSVSVDVNVVLPRPIKARDESISSCETEALSIPSNRSPTVLKDTVKSETDSMPLIVSSAAGNISLHTENRIPDSLVEGERLNTKVIPAEDVVTSPVERAADNVESDMKRTKVIPKSKTSTKDKGLLTSKSKSKVPKLKKEPSSRSVDTVPVKDDALVNGDSVSTSLKEEANITELEIKGEDVIGLPNKCLSSKMVVTKETSDTKVTKDLSRKSISPSKSSSKTKLSREDSNAGITTRLSASAKVTKENSPSNSLPSVPIDNPNLTSTELLPSQLPKQVDGNTASSLKSASKSKLNGGLTSRSSSKTRLNKVDDSASSDQIPIKSSSRSKLSKLEGIQDSSLKSGSRSKLNSTSPLKSASKNGISSEDEIKKSISLSSSDSSGDRNPPLKSPSYSKVPQTNDLTSQQKVSKAPSPDKSLAKAKSRSDGEKLPSPSKSASKQDVGIPPPTRSISKTRIPSVEEKVIPGVKQDTKAAAPVRSSSKCRINTSEERNIGSTSVTVRSSSRGRINSSEERNPTLSTTAKSSSRSRINTSEERTSVSTKQDIKSPSTPRSSSKSNIPREKDSRRGIDGKELPCKDIPQSDEKSSSPPKSISTSQNITNSLSSKSIPVKEDVSSVPPTKSSSKSRLLKSGSPARTRVVQSPSKSTLTKSDEKLTSTTDEKNPSRLPKSSSASKLAKEPAKVSPITLKNNYDIKEEIPNLSQTSVEQLDGSQPVSAGEASDGPTGEVRSTVRALRKPGAGENETSSSVRRAASSSPSATSAKLRSSAPTSRRPRARARSARPGALRSSSQSRSSLSEENVPVVSLKDVERRHREMLLDKWSKSLQTLHSSNRDQKQPSNEGEAGAAAAAAEPDPAQAQAVSPSTSDVKPVKPPRPSLHLDLFPSAPVAPSAPASRRVESPTESESLDSWSVCSADYADGRDLAVVSPTLSPHSPTTEESESVSDRIRRKSFYCRFNDIKKKKKPSSLNLSSPISGPSGRSRGLSSDYGSLKRSPVTEEYTPTALRRPTLSPTSCSPSTAGLSSGLWHNNSLKYLHNGRPTSPLLSNSASVDRSPTWDKSGIELKNELMFHSLGLHRFDPQNLSMSKDKLFEMLSPTTASPPVPEAADKSVAVEAEPEHKPEPGPEAS